VQPQECPLVACSMKGCLSYRYLLVGCMKGYAAEEVVAKAVLEAEAEVLIMQKFCFMIAA